MTDGLACELLMPLSWLAGELDVQTRQNGINEATLLLTALNQIEGMHEPDAGSPDNRRLDRIEAKLDLTLHLLARTLASGQPPTVRNVRLTPGGMQWPDPAPPAAGLALIVEFRPSDALPISLKLPAIALEPVAGQASVQFEGLTEALDEALYQFVFRRHRQAIRARTG